jgi:hypothetical protein
VSILISQTGLYAPRDWCIFDTSRFLFSLPEPRMPLLPKADYAMNMMSMVQYPRLLKSFFANPGSESYRTVGIFICLWVCLFALRSSWTVEDTILASTLIPNALQGYGLDFSSISWGFDLGRPEDLCFVRDSAGRMLPVHPVGMALFAAPIQAILWLIAWISGLSVDVSAPGFLLVRATLEKLSACFFVALSTFYLYRTLAFFVSESLAVRVAVLYTFGSSALSTLSQGLWQHTGINLILIYLAHFFLRHERPLPRGREYVVYVAFALLCGIRPTTIPLVAIMVVAFIRLFGLPRVSSLVVVGSVLVPIILWNVVIFHSVLGGYVHFAHRRVQLSLSECISRLGLILFSPQRGFVTFNPFTLFSLFVWAPFRVSSGKRRVVVAALLACIVCHYALCSTNPEWHGGYTFGPRYMLDVLAPTFLIAGIGFNHIQGRWPRSADIACALVAVISIALHLFGALGDASHFPEITTVYRGLLLPP